MKTTQTFGSMESAVSSKGFAQKQAVSRVKEDAAMKKATVAKQKKKQLTKVLKKKGLQINFSK